MTYTEESALHIERHFIVVEAHDPNEDLECRGLNVQIRALCGLTDHLHDIVALALAFKILSDEL
jgi:hypothetical protein